MADKVIELTFISIGSISFIARYIVGAIITSFMIINLGSTVSYAAYSEENTEVNSFFINFIDEAFSDISNLQVKNKAKEDITDYFLDEAREFYVNKDYDSINKIIIDGKLSILIISIIENDGYGLMATRTQTISNYESMKEEARNGNGTLVWSTLLSGAVTYEPNTGRIISATNPTLSLGYQSGGWLQPAEITNISTSKRIYNNYVQFSGKYKMIQDQSIIFDDGSVWVNVLDYGTHTHSFDAYPDF